MSRSWGHELERLSEHEITELKAEDERWAKQFGQRWFASVCRLGRLDHREPVTYRIRYRYITGRAGRVSYAERLVCETHARRFAVKHNIDFDAVAKGARQPHAAERAIAVLERGPK